MQNGVQANDYILDVLDITTITYTSIQTWKFISKRLGYQLELEN